MRIAEVRAEVPANETQDLARGDAGRIAMDDHELHYKFPPAKAYKLNKCLYMIRNDAAFAQKVLETFDGAVAPLGLAPDETEAVRARDQAKLVDLGAHPLLAFLAIYKLNITEKPKQFTYF
jgi:hypothetical protein